MKMFFKYLKSTLMYHLFVTSFIIHTLSITLRYLCFLNKKQNVKLLKYRYYY